MGNMYCEREKVHELAVMRAKEGILNGEDVQKVCKIFQILSEPSRLRIVLALLNGEMCVYHLAEVCDGTVSAISHQLRILRDNKIVKAKRFWKNIEYSIADEHVCEIVNMCIAHLYCEETL